MPKPVPNIEHIYAVASQLLNENGEEGLTMRDLANSAGCSPTSLYAHIGKRDDLLNGIVMRFFSSIDIELPVSGRWQIKVLSWARQMRAAYLINPGIVSVLRPKARWAVEATVSKQLFQIWNAAGFDDETATSLCRTFVWQVTALAAMEALSSRAGNAPIKRRRVMPNEYHRQLAGKHTLEMSGEIFDYSIALMIDGIDRENRSGNPPTVLRG